MTNLNINNLNQVATNVSTPKAGANARAEREEAINFFAPDVDSNNQVTTAQGAEALKACMDTKGKKPPKTIQANQITFGGRTGTIEEKSQKKIEEAFYLPKENNFTHDEVGVEFTTFVLGDGHMGYRVRINDSEQPSKYNEMLVTTDGYIYKLNENGEYKMANDGKKAKKNDLGKVPINIIPTYSGNFSHNNQKVSNVSVTIGDESIYGYSPIPIKQN